MNALTEQWLEPPIMLESESEKTKPPIARPLLALVRPDASDATELLRSRYLSQRGTLLLCGPTGIGKSSLALQLASTWAVGLESFGIKPARALRSLLVQAENDDGDLAEMRDGIFHGLGLSTEQKAQAGTNVIVASEDERSGFAFLVGVVRPLLSEHKPDLLWLDPALAYLGGENNSQKDVGGFLRNLLNPLLREFACGCVIVHHTNKPASGTEKSRWSAGDFAYLGAGSAEWANHARAVLALRSIGSREIFELHAAKRGARLGWRQAEGKTVGFIRYLAHAKEPGVICWREVAEDEIETGGRPKNYDIGDLFNLLPKAGLTAEEWRKQAESELGIKRSRFFDLKKKLADQKRVSKSHTTSKWGPE